MAGRDGRTSAKRRFLFYLATAGKTVCFRPLAKGIRGADRLPPEPYIIAANHRSLLDGPLLVAEFNRIRRRAMHMIAYREPFAHWFFGRILRISGCIPFDRGSPESRAMAVRQALAFLERGEPVGFFPEAHLSRTEVMRRGRPGVALVALESGVPVVPVGIRGTEQVLPPGQMRLHFHRRAEIEIGDPLDLSPFRGQFLEGDQSRRADAIHQAVCRVMGAIAAISRQEYPHLDPPRRRRTGR